MKQVAAQQRARRLLEQHLRLPAVGHVRGRDLAHPLAAEVDHLALGERAGRAVAQVVERHVAAERAVGDLAARRRREPHVHRAALVGLDVAEADPAQRLDRDHRGHRLGDQREQPAQAGVEQQRLVAGDEELVEGEARRGSPRGPGRDPVDAVGDLVDGRCELVPCTLAWRSVGGRDPFSQD